jgi:uncharacterized protein
MGDPETVADGFRRLDPRAISADRASWWIGAAIFTVVWLGLLVGLWTADVFPHWVTWALASAGLLVPVQVAGAMLWPPLAYRHCTFRLDDQGIEIRRGVVVRRVINVPRSRVQHTDVTQGPIERRYGLGTLIVYTAGTHHAMVDLPGLDYETALWARDSLLPRGPRDHADAV